MYGESGRVYWVEMGHQADVLDTHVMHDEGIDSAAMYLWGFGV